MFKERNQFNLFIKETHISCVQQVLRETVADLCLNGGNKLRNLLDSYQVFLKSGDFNKNMRDFEGNLSEFLIPTVAKNIAVYEATRLASTDMEKPAEAMDDFNFLCHIREQLGADSVFTTIQDGIKQANSWLN